MKKLVALLVIFGATAASSTRSHPSHHMRGCSAMEDAYRQGKRMSAIIEKNDYERIYVNGARVGADDMANEQLRQPPYPADAGKDFNATITLLFAVQSLCSGTADTNTMLKQHSACLSLDKRCSTMEIERCPKDQRYRSITGAWNNLKHPKWGKIFTPYGRFTPANYFDGIHEIRKSVIKREDLPEARSTTNDVLKKNPFVCENKLRGSNGGIMYGQLIAHDQGWRQMLQMLEGGLTRSCCNKDYTKALSQPPYGCHAFKYRKDDPYLTQLAPGIDIECMTFIRSQLTFPNDCKLAAAQPVNRVSHYLDMSPVYGSEESVTNSLRSFKDGQLKNNANKVLPRSCDDSNANCYETGDKRGLTFFTLGIIQSIYHRLHNIIATELKKINQKWKDEQLFQEARRINIAIYQNNIYTEWLKYFVGDPETEMFRPKGNEYLGSYNPNIDASSTVEFSHCAFRVYHANLNDKVRLYDANDTLVETINLDECDNGLKILETRYDDVVRGTFRTPSAHSTFSAIVRNLLFNNNNKYNLGLDLISTDLYIGRDVGLQPYYIYFELCTKRKVRSWNDFNHTMALERVEDLKKVYKSFKDVDAFIGMALEDKCESYLGTVGKCIVVSQYLRSRDGDRYFYSLPNGAYPFTPAQLDFIYKFKYANVLCTATNITEAPSSAFEVPNPANPMIKCIREINLSAWKDKTGHH